MGLVENFTELRARFVEPSSVVTSNGEATARSEGNAVVAVEELPVLEESESLPVDVSAPPHAKVDVSASASTVWR